MRVLFVSVLALSVAIAAEAREGKAEESFSIFLGNQSVADSVANVTDIDGSEYSFDAEWEGKSFTAPLYYGFRYTNWYWDNLGFAINFTHSKAYSTDETRADNGYNVMEFTDGINVFTANLLYRFKNASPLTPYVGVGLGMSVPHVELQSPLMSKKVFEYQNGGLATAAMIGVDYKFSEHWSVFGEGRFEHSALKVDMEDGDFETDLDTKAITAGLSYHW